MSSIHTGQLQGNTCPLPASIVNYPHGNVDHPFRCLVFISVSSMEVYSTLWPISEGTWAVFILIDISVIFTF